ncbi:hypothetical protein BSKO_10614 [Bryopsis sp. KO-2023]|nr:hypothetical protein BSKO_10614 [Bryopsis sp. KO-2023]
MVVLDVHGLPPPTSGTLAEVQFRRLLLKCAERTLTLDAWERDPKFHLYVETLQEQLSALSANAAAGLEDEILNRYKENVDCLSNSLLTPDIPLYCKKIGKVDRRILESAAGKPQAIQRTHKGEIEETVASRPKASSIPGQSKLDESAQRVMDAQKNIQESLTDDLVNLASQLKHRAKAVEKAVGERNEILDQADVALTKNADSAVDAKKRAGEQYKRSKMGTCMMLMVLLGVGFVFTWMLFFIKFTSIVGYRGQTAPAASPPSQTDHEEL